MDRLKLADVGKNRLVGEGDVLRYHAVARARPGHVYTYTQDVVGTEPLDRASRFS